MANWAPLAAIWASTPAWLALTEPSLTPLLVVSPQSPRTAKVTGAVPVAGCRVRNCGEGSVPSRSTGLAPPVVTR